MTTTTTGPSKAWTRAMTAAILTGAVVVNLALGWIFPADADAATAPRPAATATAPATVLDVAARGHQVTPPTIDLAGRRNPVIDHGRDAERPGNYRIILADGSTWTMTACPTDEAVGTCWWNARSMGNGAGRSFASIRGHLHRNAAHWSGGPRPAPPATTPPTLPADCPPAPAPACR